MDVNLNDGNLLVYAAKAYVNPSCFSTEEFQEDLNRLKYLRRLFNRFQDTGELKERLILNHIIILYNVFSHSATRMLFLKMDGQLHLLKPFLVLLNVLPDKVENVKDKEVIYTSDIPMNRHIVEVLRKI